MCFCKAKIKLDVLNSYIFSIVFLFILQNACVTSGKARNLLKMKHFLVKTQPGLFC